MAVSEKRKISFSFLLIDQCCLSNIPEKPANEPFIKVKTTKSLFQVNKKNYCNQCFHLTPLILNVNSQPNSLCINFTVKRNQKGSDYLVTGHYTIIIPAPHQPLISPSPAVVYAIVAALKLPAVSQTCFRRTESVFDSLWG